MRGRTSSHSSFARDSRDILRSALKQKNVRRRKLPKYRSKSESSSSSRGRRTSYHADIARTTLRCRNYRAAGPVNAKVGVRAPSRCMTMTRTRTGTRRETEASGSEATGGSAPLARLRAESGVFQETAVERVVETDALKTDTSNLQRPGRVELAGLVDVLWRSVLAGGEGLFDQCLGGLPCSR